MKIGIDIGKAADFLYSSDNTIDVPFRLSISTGNHKGFDLTKGDFVSLMLMLSTNSNFTTDHFERWLNSIIKD
jgi:hypothetical protein|tara:strand:- start:240 stop:458 length:219 start_codon:yes stop_codon:yes gene_type:complete